MAINEPKVRISIIPAFIEPITQEQKILFVGQKLPGGTAPANKLVESIADIGLEGTTAWDTLFGKRSMLAGMVRAAKKYNTTTRMDALVLDDGAGAVKATGRFLINSPPVQNGTATFVVASRKNHSFSIQVVTSDVVADVAARLVSAINTDLLAPFTAVSAGGLVTITVANGGLAANDFGLEITDDTGLFLSVTITAFTGGATDPDLDSSGIFFEADDIRYQTVVFPESYLSQSVAVDFLNDRFNTETGTILDGAGVAFITDTVANLPLNTTALNSQSFVLFANRKVDKVGFRGSSLFEINYDLASQFGAVRALRLTSGSDLSSLVIGATGANDKIGGPHISTLPYHNTPFKNMPIIDTDEEFDSLELVDITAAGLATIGNNIARTAIVAGEVVTRYKTDAAGDPDLSFKFLNFVDQASTVRETFHDELRADYRQFRLTEGDLLPNFNMTNASDIRGTLLRIYSQLAALAIVPTGSGALKKFRDTLVITIDAVNGKVTISMLDPVVTQIREIDVTMQLIFSLNS